MQNIIENSKLTILFDEARAINDIERIEGEYADYVKKFKKKKWCIDFPLTVLCAVAVFLIATYLVFGKTPLEILQDAESFVYGVVGLTAWMAICVTYAFILFFLGMAIICTLAKTPDNIETFYDNNSLFYLFQKGKNVVGAELDEFDDGKYCFLSLMVSNSKGNIVKIAFQTLNNHSIYEVVKLTRVLRKDVDKVTVDIVKGEVQYPYTEFSEGQVIINGKPADATEE